MYKQPFRLGVIAFLAASAIPMLAPVKAEGGIVGLYVLYRVLSGGWGGGGYYYPPPGPYYGPPPPPLTPPPPPQGYYFNPSVDQNALVTVRVPDPNARVWFNDQITGQRGQARTFHTPPLEPGYNYTYQIRAQWRDNGREKTATRTVQVKSGQNVMVDFGQAPVK